MPLQNRVTPTGEIIADPGRGLLMGNRGCLHGHPGLVAGGRLLPWSFAGYGAPVTVPPTTPVELLTPPATVAAIRAGYRPLVHRSAIYHS